MDGVTVQELNGCKYCKEYEDLPEHFIDSKPVGRVFDTCIQPNENGFWLIDGTISILIGMLCGGAGTAVISSGPNGIVAGALLSMLVLALGKDQMQTAVLNAKIPKVVRKLIPRSYMHARMGTVSKQVKGQMLQMLENEKNDEITDRLVRELSQQIEACLVHMAEVVEIPLG